MEQSLWSSFPESFVVSCTDPLQYDYPTWWRTDASVGDTQCYVTPRKTAFWVGSYLARVEITGQIL